MEISSINTPYIFRPTIRGIIILIAGILLFGTLSYSLYTTRKEITGVASFIIFYSIELFFILCFAMCNFYVFKIKTIILDKDGLQIKYPLLMSKIEIPFTKINKINASPQIIKTSTRSGIITVYEGTRILLQLDNNNEIDIDSYQTQDFDILCDMLKKYKIAI
ncbi:hypothetical protein [Parasediminibacterium sp. JCM 36343]|uniref:hypothetical protein n=1 Tax=Parasediminibacterium sp. JCM 36343 TaxID=3374279 RepID=UPI00397D79A2